MSVAIIFGIVVTVLFIMAFITKRRFGALGLALAAGSILSTLWAQKLTPLVQDAGVTITSPPLVTLVSMVLVLLPALLLLFSGPSYKDMTRRAVGAALFSLLAFAFLLEPLGAALILQAEGKQIYDFMFTNQVYIITFGLVVAVLDLLSVHTKGVTPKPEKH